jgi:WD40 repeat protein
VLAILPKKLSETIELNAPNSVAAGSSFGWSIQTSTVPVSAPVQVRLLDSTGRVLEERKGQNRLGSMSGEFHVPLNAFETVTVELLDLMTQLRLSKIVQVTPPKLPVSMAKFESSKSTALANKTTGGAKAGKPPASKFGPHIRSLAINPDGTKAILPCFNWGNTLSIWDMNENRTRSLYGLDDYFLFNPVALNNGFAVQGFDLDSAEGYFLALLDAEGKPLRKFRSFGVTHRQIHRFVPGIFKDQQVSFAVPPSGKWVATGSNFGIVVWDANGQELWAKSTPADSQQATVVKALDEQNLLLIQGRKLSVVQAREGVPKWSHELPETGELIDLKATPDGKLIAVLTSTEGGRLFLFREGKLQVTHYAVGQQLALSPDGKQFATIQGSLLRLYSAESGFRWLFHGDDFLHDLSFSPNGERLAFSSSLGNLTVVDLKGTKLLERDLEAWPHPRWTDSGELVVVTWMGDLFRFEANFKQTHQSKLIFPDAPSVQVQVPTTRQSGWINSLPEPLPLSGNLLDPRSVYIRYRDSGGHSHFQLPVEKLVDGDPTPPLIPWLRWSDINGMAEAFQPTEILLDTFRTQLRVEAITLVEDAAHPETWIREFRLESWNPLTEKWQSAGTFYSDRATHSHRLNQPVEASRFRLVLPPGMCGNLRLGEVILHGQKLGSNHPDVIAKKPVAVLFDEAEEFSKGFIGNPKYRFEGAFSGGRSLEIEKDQSAYPAYLPPFGHTLPLWDFEIVEKPEPGQYRWVEFSWKATTPETKGICVCLGGNGYGLKAELIAGETKPFEGSKRRKLSDRLPTEWQTIRVDLWDYFQKPIRLQGVEFRSEGGGFLVDRIRLGRTEDDLLNAKKEK